MEEYKNKRVKSCVLSIRVDHTDLATIAKIYEEEYDLQLDSIGKIASHAVFHLAHILHGHYEKKKFMLLDEALEYLRLKGYKEQKVTKTAGGKKILERLQEENYGVEMGTEENDLENVENAFEGFKLGGHDKKGAEE